MTPATLVFVTTTNASGGRWTALSRLLASIEAYRGTSQSLDTQMHLLLQNATEVPAGLPSWVCPLAVPTLLPLSQARNSLLARLPLGAQHLVAFPDDDCWYPLATLPHVSGAFRQNPRLDLALTRYGACPVPADAVRASRPSLQSLISSASSNTIFLRGSLVASLGPFDERLGLGTDCNGGEDTDYALRARRLARDIDFFDAPLVGHRDADPVLRSRYFSGALFAIAKYAEQSPAAWPALLRKICVGGCLTLTGKLPAGDYVRALRAALAIGDSHQPS